MKQEQKNLELFLLFSSLAYELPSHHLKCENIFKKYDYDELYFFDKQSHLNINKNKLKALISKFISKYVIIDLQFLVAIKKSKDSNQKGEITIVFKGSKEFVDWLTDFTKSYCSHNKFTKSVHSGFYQSSELFMRTIGSSKELKKSGLDFKNDLKWIKQNYTINLVGHSLGGAVACIVGCCLFDMGFLKNDFNVFTYGSPAVAKKKFCLYYQDKIKHFRVVTQYDVVPKLKVNQLSHLGDEIKLKSNSLNAHSIKAYQHALTDLNKKN